MASTSSSMASVFLKTSSYRLLSALMSTMLLPSMAESRDPTGRLAVNFTL